MVRSLLILFSLLAFFGLRCYPQKINNDYRLRELVRQFGQAEVTISYTDNNALEILTRKVSVLSVMHNVAEISLSQLTVDWFIQQKYDYIIIEKSDTKGIESAGNMNQLFEWDKYPSYSQYDSIMQSFLILYPALCRLDTIGRSVNGRLVLALKISDNAANNEEEPEVFYSSTMHGDETGGFVLMLRLADYLLKNYNLDDRVRNIIDNLEIWINPLANPDGTFGTGNIISTPVRYNANGVDLNRNFPDPLQPLEIQQKETIDMIKFMRSHKFVISANFHSGFEVVNYPWDRWRLKFHADDSWFYNISRAYADTVHYYSVPQYMVDLDDGVTRGALWYVIYGGRQDFVTYELQGREVTIELDDQHITPSSQLPLLWQYNWHSLLGYLENALYGINGRVLDSETSAPVPAKIFIEGHDKDNSQVYSDTLTGMFVRLLAQGSWTLTFTANGYYDTSSTVVVFPGQETDVNISMIPITPVDSTIPDAPALYPNPATAEIRAILPDEVTGNVNVMIINQLGSFQIGYTTEVFKGIPLLIDIRRLSPGTYSVIFTNTVTNFSSRGRFIIIK